MGVKVNNYVYMYLTAYPTMCTIKTYLSAD